MRFSTTLLVSVLHYLHAGFSQVSPQRQLLPGVNVRIVRLLENLLQLFQLVACEGGAVAPLLALVAFAAITLVQRAWQVCARRPVGGRLHALILHSQVAGVHSRWVGVWGQVRICQTWTVFTCRHRRDMKTVKRGLYSNHFIRKNSLWVCYPLTEDEYETKESLKMWVL